MWLPSTKSICRMVRRLAWMSGVSEATSNPAAAGAVQEDTRRPPTRTTHTRQLPWGASSGLWQRWGM